MKRLDLYIMRSCFGNLVYFITAFLILYVAITLFDELNVLLRTKATLADAALLILARAPQTIVLALPISSLLASVATITILTRNGEITALRAVGISLARLGRPLVLVGLTIALVQVALQEFVIPATYAWGEEIRTVRIMKLPLKSLVREGNIWFRFGNSMVHAEKMKAEDKSMEGVTVFELADSKVKASLTASAANWDGKSWVLSDTRKRTFLEGGGWEESTMPKMPYPVSVPPTELSVIKLEPEYTAMSTLGKRIKSLQRQGADVTALRVEHAKKLALPFSCLLMPFLSIPFSIRSTQRAGLWGGVAKSISLGFLYTAIILTGASLGKVGTLPPLLGAWAGNLVFLPIVYLMLRKAEEGR